LYKKEIEELYKDEKPQDAAAAVQLDLRSEDAFAESLAKAFGSTIESRADVVHADTDIFSVGIDSLGVLTVARKIKAGLQAQGVVFDEKLVSPRTIYANPIPKKLSQALLAGIHGSGSNGAKENAETNGDSSAELQKYVEEYSAGLPTVSPSEAASDEEVVVITGTTGGLGPYLLADALRRNPAHIFAFNRDPTAEKRQHASQISKGLTTDLSKVTFLTTDLSRPDLGLSEDILAKIKGQATRIVHNAWPVNFNLPLESFLPSVKGVRNLIDLAAASKYHPHITFVSTIGTAAAAPGPVKESSLPLTAARMGYGESKSICAFVLDAAREKGLSNAIVRVGQIAGPAAEKGEWNRAEWFPTIMKSSAGLGVLPSSVGAQGKRVDWLPVEAVAGTILDISEGHAQGYYHAVNPATTTFSELLPAITSYFGDRVRVVSYPEWFAALEKSSKSAKGDEDAEKVPGIKLLEFYQGLLYEGEPRVFETSKTQEASQTLSAQKPVNEALMGNWLGQWKF
jgi:thioester reductase-like protein